MFATHPEGSRRGASALASLAIHCGAAALLIATAPPAAVRQAARAVAATAMPLAAPYFAPAPPRGGGGGGGGDNSPLPASLGRLPRIAPRQFTPPAAVLHNQAPQLLIEPTIVAASVPVLPDLPMAVFGDPLGAAGPPSNGPGSGGGIGSGEGGGIGSGRGPGLGPGEGGGWGGGRGGAGGSITAAVALYSIEPEYTDEARRARLQGVVAVMVEIDERGRVRNPQLRSTLGMGLDERAVEAVSKWRFRPYLRDGKPVAGPALIEVHFRLL